MLWKKDEDEDEAEDERTSVNGLTWYPPYAAYERIITLNCMQIA